MFSWHPLRDLVMVKRLPEDTKSHGGIIFANPERAGDSTRGIVTAIGPKVRDVKVGDVVVFGPWADLLRFNETTDVLTDEVAIFPESDCRWIERKASAQAG